MSGFDKYGVLRNH